MTTPADARALLGYDDDTPIDPADLKRRYRALARIHHPDAGGDQATMARIADARDVLIEHPDPVKRSSSTWHVDVGVDPTRPARHGRRTGAGVDALRMMDDLLADLAQTGPGTNGWQSTVAMAEHENDGTIVITGAPAGSTIRVAPDGTVQVTDANGWEVSLLWL